MAPLPTCPLPLLPQQATVPSDKTAHVCRSPALMSVTVLPARAPPVTATGMYELLVAPIPSRPRWLSPQQAAVPSDNNAHVWLFPAVILMTVLPARAPPVTATGVVALVKEPIPSCPTWLAPQQAAVPSDNNAHEWPVPPVMSVKVLPVASERTLISRGVDVAAGLNAFHVEPLSEEYS